MIALNNKEMWTEEHWHLFDLLEKMYREKFSSEDEPFGNNFDEFKKHMLYILEVMENMYGKNRN